MGMLVEIQVDHGTLCHMVRESKVGSDGKREKISVKCWEKDGETVITDKNRIAQIEKAIDEQIANQSDSDYEDSDDPYEWLWARDLEEEKRQNKKKQADKEFDDLFGFRLFGYRD